MDQVKQILSVLKKYHFWILCGLITLLYLGTWFMSTSSMTKETETRVSKISGSFSTGTRIAGISNHPNPQSADMMQELNRAEADQVRLAWERRFREQEDVLKWPEELFPDFLAAVEPLKPIELKVKYPTPANEELRPDLRNRYSDYIQKELPKLAKIIGSEWRVGAAAGGGYPGMGGGGSTGSGGSYPGMGSGGSYPGMGSGGSYPGMGSGGSYPGMGSGGSYPGMGSGLGSGPGSYGSSGGLTSDDNPIVVDWSVTNQTSIQAASFNWVRPTTLQILYAQEDLWVLRALMLVIKATNGDADAQYNAAVKEIISLDLGARAAGIKSVGTIQGGGSRSGYPGSGGSMPGMGGLLGGGGSTSLPGYSGGPSGYGSGAAQAVSDPADGRYVDDTNEPILGSRLRSAMESNQPSDAFLAVAKRMPVRLRVRMNVLKLPLLLCECANSRLPIEVRQVRVNTPPAGLVGGAGPGFDRGSGSGRSPMGAGTGSGGGAGMSMPSGTSGGAGAGATLGAPGGGSSAGLGGVPGMGGGSYPGMGGGGSYPGGGDPGGSGSTAATSDSPYDATVEIYGIIYIYNPVDPAKLGIEKEKPAASEAAATGEPAANGDAAADATAEDAAEAAADGTPPADAAGTTPAAGTGSAAASNPAGIAPATDAAGGTPATGPPETPAAPAGNDAVPGSTPPAAGTGGTGTSDTGTGTNAP